LTWWCCPPASFPLRSGKAAMPSSTHLFRLMEDSIAEIRTEFDNRAFVPGDTLRGTVSWRAGTTPKQVELRLFYYTTGKGTRDVVVFDRRDFEAPLAEDERPFEFTLPAGPPSFSGKLVSLIWSLELGVGDDLLVEDFEFVLSPTGEELNLYRHASDDMPSYSDFMIGSRRKR